MREVGYEAKPDPISSARGPRRIESLVEYPLDDELILYDRTTERAILLNRGSAAVWDLCDGERSVEEIALEIASAFQVSVSVVLDDTRRVLSGLEAEGVIGLQPGSPDGWDPQPPQGVNGDDQAQGPD